MYKRIIKLFFLLIGLSLAYIYFKPLDMVNRHKILWITNYDENIKYIDSFKKGIDTAINDIEKKYPKVEVLTINISDDISVQADEVNRLKKLLDKNDFIYIIAPSKSKTFGMIATLLPPDVPVMTGIATLTELQKYRGEILFTEASKPQYYKSKDIIDIKHLANKKHVINIYEHNNSEPSYTHEIINSLEKDGIEVIHYPQKNITKSFFDKYGNNSLIIVSGSSTKNTYNLLRKIEFKAKNLEYIFDKKYNLNFYLIYSSPSSYDYKSDYSIFSSGRNMGVKINQEQYKYLKNLNSEDDLKQFSNGYKSYYAKSMLVLKRLNTNKELPYKIIKKQIYSLLINTSIEHPFIENETKYVFAFKKDKNSNIYYNTVAKHNILQSYIFNLNSGNLLLFRKQMITNKETEPVYITPYIKKLKVLSLDAKQVQVNMIVKIISSDNTIDLGKDITFDTSMIYENNRNIKLLRSSQSTVNNITYYHKVYNVELIVDIKSQLFNFPLDKQTVNIHFRYNDFSLKPIIIQPINEEGHIADNISKYWEVIDYYMTYSRQIYKLDNSIIQKQHVFSAMEHYFTINIKRKDPIAIIIKYFLPALIILILSGYVGFFVSKKYITDKIEIISDGLLGIISIYFIYSLLIQIETLIAMDLIFYALLMFVVLIIYYVMGRLKVKPPTQK